MHKAKDSQASANYQLKRALGLPLITLYGVGSIIGAGIYVLIGKVAAQSGVYMPVAFLVAALVVTFTALSYAELASHFPRSAGESVYVDQAFARAWLTLGTGIAVVLIGAVSAATISRGSVGYLQVLVDWPALLLITLFVGMITFIACRGVLESVGIAALITLIEVAGIIAMLLVTRDAWLRSDVVWSHYSPGLSREHWMAVSAGAFLAFYAYIGFEDMVNMAEEVKRPEINMPRSIVLALIVTTVLYGLVAWAAINALPPVELAASDAPFASLVAGSDHVPVWAITVVSLVAVTNGALIQIIMGARVLYGLAGKQLLPAWLYRVHPQRRIPVNATLLIGAVVLVLALLLPLEMLARITSAITLLVFAMVNLSLIVLKRRGQLATSPALEVTKTASSGRGGSKVNFPLAVPVLGLLLSLLFVLVQFL